MGATDLASSEHETDVILVRLWAAARAAAGTTQVTIPTTVPLRLDEVIKQVLAGRPERLAEVLPGCSVLLGDQPVATRDPADVVVRPGDTLEFLPPFAGG